MFKKWFSSLLDVRQNGVRPITKERYCTEVVQLTDKKFLKFVVLFFSKTTTTILITTGIELLRASLAKLQMSWKERQVGAVAFWPLMLFLLYWIWNSSDGKWWWWWPWRAWEILLLLTLRNANYRVHFNKKIWILSKGLFFYCNKSHPWFAMYNEITFQ